MTISLEELAKLAGVSKTTVSMVLNNRADDYRISAQTQQRIRTLAEAHQFTPNRLAQGLRLRKTRTLGVVVPSMVNWVFAQVSEKLEQLARESGYQIFFTVSEDDDASEAQLIQNLLARKVDGLLVASVLDESPSPKKTPVVYIDRRVSKDTASWVVGDDYQGSYQLIRELCCRNHQQIWYLGGMQSLSSFEYRLKGYRMALEDHGVPFDSKKVLFSGNTAQDGYHLARSLVRTHGAFPQAVYTSAFTLLEGVLQYIREHGLSLAENTQFCTYDDHPMLDYVPGNIPSVRQDTQAMARISFELLMEAQEGATEPQQVLVPPKLILRWPE